MKNYLGKPIKLVLVEENKRKMRDQCELRRWLVDFMPEGLREKKTQKYL